MADTLNLREIGNVYDIFNMERSALTFYHVISFGHRTLDKTSFTRYRKA